MPEVPTDAERIVRILFDNEVDYLLIGGLADQTHGHLRPTMDVDILPAPQPANLERLAAALREMQARPLNPGTDDDEITGGLLSRPTYGSSPRPTVFSTLFTKCRGRWVMRR